MRDKLHGGKAEGALITRLPTQRLIVVMDPN